MDEYVIASQFEHLFWLQVMGDHARFIRTGLAPDERELVTEAGRYQMRWDELLERARSLVSVGVGDWSVLAQEALALTERFGEFKLEIINRQLANKVSIDLTPTFLSHMVNELEEYLMILQFLAKGETPLVPGAVHNHLIWLLDAVGHAEFLQSQLDSTQTDLTEEAKEFKEAFCRQHVDAIEFKGLQRTGRESFPSLARFTRLAYEAMEDFKDYLESVEEMLRSDETIGSLSVLVPDHMYREECYYQHKLYMADPGNIERPACYPGRNREER